MLLLIFPPRPWLTIDCDSIKDQFIRKDWNDMWVAMYHMVKSQLNYVKNKKELSPWGVMPFTDWELLSSSILGLENNVFQLCFSALLPT